MDLRTPLGRVRGLGSAKNGVHHWWAQRLTAIALIPLGIWIVATALYLLSGDYAAARETLSGPITAAVWILSLVALFHHAQLGAQVILEDYVHHEGLKFGSIIVMKLVFAALALIAIISVLRITLGS